MVPPAKNVSDGAKGQGEHFAKQIRADLTRLYKVGFFAEQITTEDAYAEWLDVDLIVINAVDTDEPICRLEIR